MHIVPSDSPSVSLLSWAQTAHPLSIDLDSWADQLDDLLFGSSAAALSLAPLVAVGAMIFS